MDWERFRFDYRLRLDDLRSELIRIEAYKEAALNLVLPPDWRAQLDRLNRVRAVHGTTALEGNPLSEAEVRQQLDMLASETPADDPVRSEYVQVRNASRAQDWVRQRFTEGARPLHQDDVLHLHALVTQGSDERDNVPGRLRTHPVVVGAAALGGVHRGAPAPELGRLMAEFVAFMNSRRLAEQHPVVRALLAHFFLVTTSSVRGRQREGVASGRGQGALSGRWSVEPRAAGGQGRERMTGMAPTRAGVRYDSVAFVLPIYFGLTLLMTFPLVLNWRSALPDGGSDLWLNYWNFWWWKQSLLEWRSPFWSSVLFHPFGVDLRCHTHSAFNQILAMPVNLAAGEAAAYNFCVFFQLTLAAFAAWLLVRHVTGNAGAAFLAGLIFAFLPYTMDQSLEHLNLVSTGFLPLVLFFLLRWRRSWRIRDALGFGACFGLNALCSWHLGILASLVVAPGIILSGWKARRSGGNTMRAYVRGVLAAGAVGALLMLPFVPLDGFTETNGCVKWRTVRGIDPTFLLTPSYANPVVGPIVSERYVRRAYTAVGFVCYLGFIPLGLAAAAGFANFRRVRGWLALFAVAMVLAVGSPLIWDGVVRESVVLPFELVRELPVVKHLRVAHRFMALVGLALAVLAGYGAVSALKALPPGWRRCALPVAAVVLLTEYSWLPYPIRTVEHSPLLQEVAARPGAVLDVPFFRRPHNVRNQVAQQPVVKVGLSGDRHDGSAVLHWRHGDGHDT